MIFLEGIGFSKEYFFGLGHNIVFNKLRSDLKVP